MHWSACMHARRVCACAVKTMGYFKPLYVTSVAIYLSQDSCGLLSYADMRNNQCSLPLVHDWCNQYVITS